MKLGRFYQFLFLFVSHHLLCTCHEIYLSNLTEDLLLNAIRLAENELKIYIYNSTDAYHRPIPLKDSLKHFRSEYLFIDYLQMIQASSDKSDHRKSMIVSDPEEANIFIIEHRVFNGKFDSVEEMTPYIRAVIDRVLIDLPYYNRSDGKDHYFFGVHSNGPFCMDGWRAPLAEEFRRLVGANYIGNYGMDDEYEQLNRLDESAVSCHRVGKDIVIPQYMGQWPNMFLSHSNLYRPYDSVWAGSIWGDREPLVRMNESMQSDYEYFKTEKFFASFGGRRRLSSQNINSLVTRHPHPHRQLINSDVAHIGYFGYNPCGMVCWSQRLYFELNQYTIPIIVSSGGILPFDRFLNWTAFTMKITSEIWNEEDLLIPWRQKIRKESDHFRSILDDYFDYYIQENQIHNRSKSEEEKNEIVSDILRSGRSFPGYSRFKGSYIWKKRVNIEEVLPWLYLKDDIKKDWKKHAFRLLCLEMWCRMSQHRKKVICGNRSDRTSRMSYV